MEKDDLRAVMQVAFRALDRYERSPDSEERIAALDDLESFLMLMAGYAGHLAGEGERRSKGGKNRAEKARQARRAHWTTELFDRAYDQLSRDDAARVIGPDRLVDMAWKLAGRDHQKRDEITQHRARTYLKARSG